MNSCFRAWQNVSHIWGVLAICIKCTNRLLQYQRKCWCKTDPICYNIMNSSIKQIQQAGLLRDLVQHLVCRKIVSLPAILFRSIRSISYGIFYFARSNTILIYLELITGSDISENIFLLRKDYCYMILWVFTTLLYYILIKTHLQQVCLTMGSAATDEMGEYTLTIYSESRFWCIHVTSTTKFLKLCSPNRWTCPNRNALLDTSLINALVNSKLLIDFVISINGNTVCAINTVGHLFHARTQPHRLMVHGGQSESPYMITSRVLTQSCTLRSTAWLSAVSRRLTFRTGTRAADLIATRFPSIKDDENHF